MQIDVTIKTIYGAERIYPACNQARLFCEIAGTHTLTRLVIARIKQLGYTVHVLPSQPTEI
jgi:hypothetical protein